MRILGEIALQVAFASAGFSAFASLLAGRRSDRRLARWGSGSAVVATVASLLALASLAYGLVTRDFSYEYVAHYASTALPWHYCLAALWVGQAGSLLLWTGMSAALALGFRCAAPAGRFRDTAFGLLLGNVAFLLAIQIFAADSFAASLEARREGLGLSPLLQHPSMLIHPPVVFLSYALWAIPCAAAVASLLVNEPEIGWLKIARPWSLAAWLSLGIGLLLGAHWAYQELGWGGYWGWDPVENGSFLPWLTGTAFVHASMAWKYRGALKKATYGLAAATFGLCNFATFLTRSGIFSSVHAFSQSPIGWMFLLQMIALAAGVVFLVATRRGSLVADRPLGHWLAREALVAFSIYLLLLLAAVVFVGTLCIPLSGWALGRTIQIGPEFYNRVFAPLSVAALGATALAPLVRWGAAPTQRQVRALTITGGIALAAAAVCLACGARHPLALSVAFLAALMPATMVAGVWIDASRRRIAGPLHALAHIALRRRSQYAGYGVHLGLAAIAIGVTGSSLGTQRLDVELDEGQTLDWAGRTIEMVALVQREEPDRLVAEVELRIATTGDAPVLLRPARHLHALQNEWTSEVAIDSTWSGDFYAVLNAGLGDGRVQMTLVSNPLIRFLWLGGWIAGGATLVAAWPARRRQQASSMPDTIPFPVRERQADSLAKRRRAA